MTAVRFLLFALACLWLAICSQPCFAGDTASRASDQNSGFLDRMFRDDSGEHRYVVFVPEGEPPRKGWPVILFLHGAGERGSDGRRQLNVGLAPFLEDRRETFPGVVVFPQCEDMSGPILTAWQANGPDGRRALDILSEVEEEFPIDVDRRALTGWSMGGYGAWSLASHHPEMWSAVLPVSGGGPVESATSLTSIPVWAIHGAKDAVVHAEDGRKFIQAIRDAGGSPTYTEVANAGHEVWAAVYDHPAVLAWLLSPSDREIDPDTVKFSEVDRNRLRQLAEREAFVPALTIQRALAIHVGDEALAGLSQGLHGAVDRTALQGALNDFQESLSVNGVNLTVSFRGLAFDADLFQVVLKTPGADQLSIRLDLHELRLSINEIGLEASGFKGTAGQVEIVMGHRRPVSLSLLARPKARGGQLLLELLRADFHVPDDNWYVVAPREVAVTGNRFSKEDLRIAVMGGLYQRRSEIEEQVLSAVPKLLTRLEERLTFDGLGDLVAAMWPIPVYRPRSRILVESVACDLQGISATFSVEVAAIDSDRRPGKPLVLDASVIEASSLAPTDDVRIFVASQVFEETSQLLSDSGRARIHTVDVPGQPFANLRVDSTLGESVPGLRGTVADDDVRAEFILTKGFQVHAGKDSSGATSDSAGIEITIPGLQLLVSRRQPVQVSMTDGSDRPADQVDPGEFEWQPYAEVDFQIRQSAEIEIARNTAGRPRIEFSWGPDPDITGQARFVTDAPPAGAVIDIARLSAAFRESWEKWTTRRISEEALLRNLVVGQSQVVPSKIEWFAESLGATFEPPVTRIVNRDSRSVEYSVRGPFSPWSATRILAAGVEHTYKVPYPLTLRWNRDPMRPKWKLPPGASGIITRGQRGRTTFSLEGETERTALNPMEYSSP